jgi:hypothetical protein
MLISGGRASVFLFLFPSCVTLVQEVNDFELAKRGCDGKK